MAYATYTEVKTYANITASTDDALLTTLIEQAQALFERACRGRTFEASSDSVRYFDAVKDVDGETLYLDQDLCQITSIVNGDGTTVTSGQYTPLPRNEKPWFAVKLLASSGVAWTYADDPESAIAVTGRWAWSLTPPHDVKWAVIRLTAWLYRQRDLVGTEADRPALSPSGAVLLPGKLPDDVLAVARKYRR